MKNIFFRKKEVKEQAKKIDKLITWLIIGWAVASMIWISKTTKWKNITENVKKSWTNVFQKSYKLFWKLLLWFLKIFNKHKK